MASLNIRKFDGMVLFAGLSASPCSADFPTGGFTQTLSGFTKLRFVVPSEVGLPKPNQLNAAHFFGFFASHLFTKASF
jgi:hypothetical protein